MRLFTRFAAVFTGAVLAVAGLSAPAMATGSKPCAAYVYWGTSKTLCDRFDGWQDVDCPDIKRKIKVVGRDTWRLDRDGDKCGCDTPPTTSPTTTPTTSPTTTPTTQPTTTAPTTPATSSPTATAPPTTTPATTSPTATATASETETEPAGAALPLTGPSGPVIGAVALLLLAAGAGMVWLVRRRRTRFVS